MSMKHTNNFIMRKIIFPFLIAIALTFSSCEELLNNTSSGDGLTTERVVEGLKKALEIGADSASNVLHATDGYYKDQAVKILLPEEAQIVYATQQKLDPYFEIIGFSLEDQIEKVVKGINRAAEDAADDAKPIFVNAITSLDVQDAWDILEGRVPTTDTTVSFTLKSGSYDSTAATQYFVNTTYTALVDVFSTPIDNALDKDLGLGFSANKAWETLTENYNLAVGLYNDAINLNPFNTSDEIETINVSIAEHCTQKALDGLFLKVGNEEKKIRRNPYQWAVDVIQEVFGYIQEQLEG